MTTGERLVKISTLTTGTAMEHFLNIINCYKNNNMSSITDYTITFSEKNKGWTSFHSWQPSLICSLNNKFFTIKAIQKIRYSKI
jgi:hypothetical protein